VLGAAREALATGLVQDAIAVIAPGDAALECLTRQAGVRMVVNPLPERGLSSSLRIGLRALESDVGAAALLLADQPLVRVAVLDQLIMAWRAGRGTLMRPRYADAPDEPGHPVLADRSLWALADRLTGEQGFATLLPTGSPGVAFIDMSGRNPDIDTPDDLTSLEGSWS
jgi:molybdenum cofactor cytidylyltransferase